MNEKQKLAAQKVFQDRLDSNYDELKWLYMELYNDEESFERYIEMLSQAYSERNASLKKLDKERVKNPTWYRSKDMLGMQAYVDGFAGNLKGVQEKVPYLEEAGINLLHLMPLLETPEGRSDGGYAVADFRKVQPELGTIQDLARLTRDCRKRGICVCLDFVMNHTSEDHEWAMRAKAGEKEYQDYYFFYDNWDIPDQYEQTVPQVFPVTAPGNFSWCEEAGKIVMTSFYPYQWDLDYRNPVVMEKMTENMLYLCNKGIDIIRLDAVPYIWKELGTSCRNLPEVHNLVRIMHISAAIVCPGTLLLGEVVMEPSKVVPYFGSVEKPECQMLYNATTMCTTWHTVATRDVRLLRYQLDQVFGLPKDYLFLNYLRCHDDIGWGLDYDFLGQFGWGQVAHKKYLNDYLTGTVYGNDARGELYNNDPRLGDARLCGTTASLVGIEAAEFEGDEAKLDRAIRYDLMLHAFLMTQRGLPIIYSGDEIGQLNDYTYHDHPLKFDDSRYIHRGARNWEETELRNDESSRQGRLFTQIRMLEETRRKYDAFDNEADCWTVDTGSDNVLGIGRYYQGEKLMSYFNFGDNDVEIFLTEDGAFTNLATGETVEAKTMVVPAGDYIWLHQYM